MRRATILVMLCSFVFVVGYDVVVATNAATGDTISEIQAGWSWSYQTLPFAWGVVVAHLFWPALEVTYKWQRLYCLWCIGLLVIAVDRFVIGQLSPIYPLVAGTVAGRLLWPQPVPVPRLR